MKKIFTLVIIALTAALSTQAQTVVINKTDGTSVTYNVSEVQNIAFNPASTSVGIAGNYEGSNTLKVGPMPSSYVANNVTYHVESNSDGTINITTADEEYKGTQMGDLKLGAFTIRNISYDNAAQAYVRDYTSDGVRVRFKSSMGMDGEYSFTSGKITASLDSDGKLHVTNVFKIGRMPFEITATFVGTKE